MSDFLSVERPGPSPRAMLFAMLLSITAVGVTLGITAPLFSVVLDHMGLNSALVGLNTSLGVGATLVMAPLVPRLLAHVSLVAVMFGGILLSAGGLVVAGFIQTAGLWFVLRFVIGIGLALHWVISETCINQFSPEANRGLITGVYSALFGLGFAVGPLVLQFTGVDGPAPFLVSAVLVLAAALPLGWIRGDNVAKSSFVRTASEEPASPGVLVLAPIAMLTSLVSGFMDSATLALLPLYGLGAGMSQSDAIGTLAVVALGAVALQLPIGWFADRFGRRDVLLGCAAVSVITGALLPLALGSPWLLDALLFAWGGVVVAFYTLALTLLGSAFRGALLARASSALVMAYCLGSVIGPPVAGAAMDGLGSMGFVLTMVLTPLLLIVVAVLHGRQGRFQ